MAGDTQSERASIVAVNFLAGGPSVTEAQDENFRRLAVAYNYAGGQEEVPGGGGSTSNLWAALFVGIFGPIYAGMFEDE